MKKISIKFLLVAMSFIMATACNDILEQEVPGKLAEDEFYKNDEDGLIAVTGIYDMMSAHYYTNWASIYVVKMMLSDESNAGGSNDGDQPGYQNLDDFKIDSQNDKIQDTWKALYYTIYRANKVINNLPGDTDLQKRLIAEAKTLRAMNYFELVTLWGPVPLIFDDVAPSSYSSILRAPIDEVYAQIELDLTEAIPVLPLVSQYSSAEKYRVSKGTAQAALGKAYLYQEKWSAAAEQFDEVITSDQYALESELQYAFDVTGEFGKESIFELSYSSAAQYDWGNFPWGDNPESNIHVQLMGPRADFYTMAPTDTLLGGWGFNVPTEKMYDAFVDAGDVNRRVVSIISETELEAAGGDWSVDDAWDFEGFFQRKYGSFSNQRGEPVGDLNYGTNWRVIRYADVLLMAAEANYRNNNEGAAQGYLNQVRTRPGTALAAITPSGTSLFDAIVLERQLELAFEGHRFLDLVRWGLADQELGPLGFVKGTHEVLPVPLNDVRTAGLEQNFGY
ncbi:RagB/SusD family nutrient uptake outer membrane protein [Gilvimarinus agarilyticus]|uniref:RagB/SusD family nutrient uptake outer membrane protein n=1 Tax=Reichenbachiella agariperforans TaxID=156994 RepID=UPI001C096C0E|nr:RagB/SusD family nutrient uptake outer membrane protein [Reichenbachiella agariperforans]MBU2887956.1 RagB/SusD family nutrient uptake outer membrane protein [Gilvimarinus agarilyticus]MBU2913404.1 RagB/SusD family nutrient uptake outer membrane protein [Reichenbachiella agariperforans]